MKIDAIFTLLLWLCLTACNKDEFPDEFSITGIWIEQTSDTSRTEVEFRNGNRAFIREGSSQPVDTLRYKLDKTDELQLFMPGEFPDGIRTFHKLTYSQKTKELTIHDLAPYLFSGSDRMVLRRK